MHLKSLEVDIQIKIIHFQIKQEVYKEETNEIKFLS